MRTREPLALLAIGVLLGGAMLQCSRARGADSDYCRLYSREYVVAMIRQLAPVDQRTVTIDALRITLSRAFARCLNSDEAPQVLLEDDEAWLSRIERGLAELAREQEEAPPPPSPSAVAGEPSPQASGPAARGSKEWNDWCRRNYRSFNAKDGTVKKLRAKRRSPCPGPG